MSFKNAAAQTKAQDQNQNAALLAEIAALKAENARLAASKAKAKGESRLTLKVSAKGAVSVYGLGRWPVTLYRSQWERLLGIGKDIAQFIVDHKAELTDKNDEKDNA